MAGRFRRIAPPAALFAGLFLFGVSLLVLGTEASEEGTIALDPSSLTVVNDTALLVYPVGYYGSSDVRVNVTYAFPQAAGDAFFVGCADNAAMKAGGDPVAAPLAFTRLREGSFVVSSQTVPRTAQSLFYTEDPETGRIAYCKSAVVFRWAAVEGDPATNRPEVSVVYHSAALDEANFALLAILMGGGAALALGGGLRWARARPDHDRRPPADDSTVEALRASLDRMGEQLERTRQHLLYAGILGVFLWYPVLVPWAWQQAARSSDDPVIPWAVAALTLVFLLVLTVLWAREFLQLDRELSAWRGRMWELRHREEGLMDTLDLHGR